MGRRNQALGTVGASTFAGWALRDAGCAAGRLWQHRAWEHPFASQLHGPPAPHQICLSVLLWQGVLGRHCETIAGGITTLQSKCVSSPCERRARFNCRLQLRGSSKLALLAMRGAWREPGRRNLSPSDYMSLSFLQVFRSFSSRFSLYPNAKVSREPKNFKDSLHKTLHVRVHSHEEENPTLKLLGVQIVL